MFKLIGLLVVALIFIVGFNYVYHTHLKGLLEEEEHGDSKSTNKSSTTGEKDDT